MKKKPKFTTVRWLDHNSDSAWKTPKEIEAWVSKPTICITKGWLTYEDSKVLVLSASFDGDESWGENMCILKINIIK